MNAAQPNAPLNLGANGIVRVTGQFNQLIDEHPWKHGCDITDAY